MSPATGISRFIFVGIMTVQLKNTPGLPHSQASVAESCYHCGTLCDDHPIVADEKTFCCEGCHWVYDMLSDNGLCDYYRIASKPGTSIRGVNKGQYAFLDDASVEDKLLDFKSPQLAKVRFHLPQMHCTACIWLLENLYKLNPAVQHSQVHFLKRTIQISYDPGQISLRGVVELLAHIGYPPSLSFENLQIDRKHKTDKSLFYKLGISGFAFGNIMLLSFPEYLGLEDGQFGRWFGYISLVLSLPVLFYAGKSYIQSAWLGLRQRSLNLDVPIALGMLTLFLRSGYEILFGVGAGYLDSLAGFVFFLLIGKWFQQKTYHRLSFDRDYTSYMPISALLKLADDSLVPTALHQLRVGDIVCVKSQEMIPADGVLLAGDGRIDYSFVSGESDPVHVQTDERVYAGGRQTANALDIQLIKPVEQSYLTELWNNSAFSEHKTESSRLVDTMSAYFTMVILAVALGTLLYWLPRDVHTAVQAFTAVFIVACPCAIALAIPFTYGNTLRLLGRIGFYLKNTRVLEQMQTVQNIVFDKTGTLTDNTHPEATYNGTLLNEEEKNLVKSLASQSSHPRSRNLVSLFGASSLLPVKDVTEYPGQGIEGLVAGRWVQIGSAAYTLAPEGAAENAGVCICIDNQWMGAYTFRNQYRPALQHMLERLRKAGFRLSLLSGDNDRERTRLADYFLATESLYFFQSPQDKLDYVLQQQQQKKSVMMIGDGLNDAGALKQSDIGIVVTEDVNNFSPACDAILAANALEKLPAILALARQNRYILYGAYGLAFIYNVVGLSFAVRGLLSPVIAAILMPLSSITIVVYGVAMSTWLARRIGAKSLLKFS